MNTNSALNYGEVKQRKGISGSTLKIIACITMLIDHTAATIIDRIFILKNLDAIDTTSFQGMGDFIEANMALVILYGSMRLIGRLAFPIYCFLLIEGFQHTRNVGKYALRLAIFAAVSELPFDLAFNGSLFEKRYQNVFFTLLIGLLVLQGFWWIKEKASVKKWLPILSVLGAIATGYTFTYFFSNLFEYFYSLITGEDNNLTGMFIVAGLVISIILILIYLIMCKKTSLELSSVRFADLLVLMAGMALATILNTDYSAMGVLTIAIMYGLRKSNFKSMLGGCITLTIMSITEVTAFIDLIFIRFYSGKRGINLKYVFYLFYPVHLLILYFICYLMNIL